MQDHDSLTALRALDRARGSSRRTLRIGEWRLAVEGLDGPLAMRLDRRWGGFVVPESSDPPRLTVQVLSGPARGWLVPVRPGEQYRIEARKEGECTFVLSYHFALWPDEEAGLWRCALTEQDEEPAERTLENALRYLVARASVEDGGFALHASGVLDAGCAYLFAGPSRAGKSTAVALSRPRRSLGDDFALVLRRAEGWCAPAVPFDNAECAPVEPPRGLFPAAGIWRLFQAEAARVEALSPTRAVSSLLACVVLPWTMPDLSQSLLDQVRRFVTESRFEHLHFRREPDFWDAIRRGARHGVQ